MIFLKKEKKKKKTCVPSVGFSVFDSISFAIAFEPETSVVFSAALLISQINQCISAQASSQLQFYTENQ